MPAVSSTMGAEYDRRRAEVAVVCVVVVCVMVVCGGGCACGSGVFRSSCWLSSISLYFCSTTV